MYIFGIFGMILVQFSTCMQIYKLYKSKKTGGLSVGFLWMIGIGLCNYLTYSIHIHDVIYIISNSIGIFFISISIGQFYYYKRREDTKTQRTLGLSASIHKMMGGNSDPYLVGKYYLDKWLNEHPEYYGYIEPRLNDPYP